MMVAPEERQTNQELMFPRTSSKQSSKKTEPIFSLADVITVGRPLEDLEEARVASLCLNNVLAFIEYGAASKTFYPADVGQIESIMEGLGEIMGCCRLVSLRIEKFLDLQEETK